MRGHLDWLTLFLFSCTNVVSPTNNSVLISHRLIILFNYSLLTGGIVALGKFDALHIGHRELVIQAAKIGVPYLLSFVGMAEILGWERR